MPLRDTARLAGTHRPSVALAVLTEIAFFCLPSTGIKGMRPMPGFGFSFLRKRDEQLEGSQEHWLKKS